MKIVSSLPQLGERLKERRLELRLTQRIVAAHLGVRERTLLLWEKGRHEIGLISLLRLCSFYQCTPDALLLRKGEPTPREGYRLLTAEEITKTKRVLQWCTQAHLARVLGIYPATLGRALTSQKSLPVAVADRLRTLPLTEIARSR